MKYHLIIYVKYAKDNMKIILFIYLQIIVIILINVRNHINIK